MAIIKYLLFLFLFHFLNESISQSYLEIVWEKEDFEKRKNIEDCSIIIKKYNSDSILLKTYTAIINKGLQINAKVETNFNFFNVEISYNYNEDDRKYSSVIKKGSKSSVIYYEYENNLLINETIYGRDTSFIKYTYQSEKLTEIAKCSPRDTFLIINFEYKKGQVIEKVRNIENNTVATYNYQLSKDGIKKVFFNNRILYCYLYEEGKRIESTEYNEEGKVKLITTSIFVNEVLLETVSRNKDGKLIGFSTFTYISS